MPKYTLSTWEYAQLSEAIYEQKKPLEVTGGKKPTLILDNGTKFFVHMKSAPNASEYQGALLEKATKDGKPTGEFITVHRGSESGKDWIGNFQAIRDGKHPQEQVTKDFALAAMHKAQELAKKNNTDYSMTNTGHSLGGYDSHIAHLANRGKVVAFNALNPAFSNEWNNSLHKINHNMIENHIMILDIATSAHKYKMPGSVHMYARKEDLATLVDSGYGNTKPNKPIDVVLKDTRKAFLSSDFSIAHSNDNFAGVNSVLKDPQAKVRANEWKKLSDEWRSEVPENREAIINNINSAIQKYQKINDLYEQINPKPKVSDGLNLAEVNLQDVNTVKVASANKNFIPNLSEQNFSPSTQKLFQQYDEKFTALCERRGITADCKEDFENLRGAAVATALANGLPSIEKVEIDQDRVLWMGSYNPRPHVISLSTDEAVNIPVSQSMANIHTMEQQNAQQSQERQMIQSQQQNQGRTIG